MYKLPYNFDGSFLIGRILEQVCFNLNQICLHFDNNVSIVVESSFSYQYLDCEQNCQLIDVPVLKSDIMQLLGEQVSHVSGDEKGTLSLIFDNGHIFRCYDTSTQYE